MTFILLLLALAVGYMLGEWRTLKKHENQMMHTNKELVFWKDVAERQRLALRGPLDEKLNPPSPPDLSPNDAKKEVK